MHTEYIHLQIGMSFSSSLHFNSYKNVIQFNLNLNTSVIKVSKTTSMYWDFERFGIMIC